MTATNMCSNFGSKWYSPPIRRLCTSVQAYSQLLIVIVQKINTVSVGQ